MVNQLINLIQKKLNSFEYVLNSIIQEALQDNKKLLTDLNREQLMSGLLSDNTPTPPYSINTLEMRELSGKPYNRNITLFDTGDFQSFFGIDVENGLLDFYSLDWKSEMLIQEYGKYIFGLTEENFDKAFNEIRPIVKEKIEKWIVEK